MRNSVERMQLLLSTRVKQARENRAERLQAVVGGRH